MRNLQAKTLHQDLLEEKGQAFHCPDTRWRLRNGDRRSLYVASLAGILVDLQVALRHAACPCTRAYLQLCSCGINDIEHGRRGFE